MSVADDLAPIEAFTSDSSSDPEILEPARTESELDEDRLLRPPSFEKPDAPR